MTTPPPDVIAAMRSFSSVADWASTSNRDASKVIRTYLESLDAQAQAERDEALAKVMYLATGAHECNYGPVSKSLYLTLARAARAHIEQEKKP